VDFTEFHEELRSTAREVLAGNAGAPPGGGGAAGPPQDTQAEWRQFADLGWTGIEVPEALGGAGATFAEAAVLLQEMGRSVTSSPYLGTATHGVGTLNLLAAHPDRDVLLHDVATGRRRLAVPLTDVDGDPPEDVAPFRLQESGPGLRLHGRSMFVPDAPDADGLLIVAIDPDGRPVTVHLDADSAGLAVTPQPVLDLTRRFGAVVADGVEVGSESVLRFAGDPAKAVRLLWDRAALSIACDSLGLSEAMLTATVSYACSRAQFGRPIGSFQAVKHACANMLVKISVARSLLSCAVRQLVAVDDDRAAVLMAKSYVCTTAVEIAGSALQLHGGIGYTWDSGVHTYLKRAALNRSLFGSPVYYHKRLAERYVYRARRRVETEVPPE